ncbi:amino acid ABC transporter permease [Frigidibacter sp. ROC022]|uniref:amino acid ABC transporter permease n=1 Tax=Frigidibacter sp. ROC022 TaxID=2971796 RepID=UPI00215AF60B|nr:amino acid ABC transporter permease [Frigidibacter sp. ROC022]MCR8723386.1 amino acid ABC transporter permease [Frigidibacter sp. ROC022]
MDQLIQQFFNIDIMMRAWPTIMRGLGVTLLICCAVIPLGLAGGLIAALASTARSRWLRWPAVALVDLFRAIPPLVLLIFVYAGLPFTGIQLSPFVAVTVAFLLNNSAYYGEVFRAGLISIGKGQAEAARSTGLTQRQTLVHVILPQAIRNVLPDLISNTVEVVKLTSLASVVSLGELLHAADLARSVTYNASPLTLAAGVYLVLIWPVVRLLSRYQRRISV